jgi:hypothetical protein
MSDTTQRILDDHQFMNAAQLTNDGAQFGLFSGIFSTVEKALEGPAHFFVLPTALFGDVMRSIFTLWEWFNAKNKNLRKTAKLLLEIVKTAVVGTAIIGSMAGCALIAAITPFLFVGGLASATLYHAVLTGYHGYKWFNSTPAAAPHHKKLFFINLWVMGALAALTAAVSVVLAFKPEIGILKSVVSYVAVAMSGLSTLLFGTMAAKIIWARKKAPQIATVGQVPEPGLTRAPSVETINAEVIKVEKPLKLAHEDLVVQMHQYGDAEERQQFVLELMQAKTKLLEEKPHSSFFYKDQNLLKRQAITLLSRLVKNGQVKVGDTEIKNIPELLDYFDNEKCSSSIFHSFFREVGEMQKLFILVDNYLQTPKPENPFSTSPRLSSSLSSSLT